MNRLAAAKCSLRIEKANGSAYTFIFTDTNEQRGEALRMLGRYASDPDLDFTWYDAAVLAQKIRQSAAKPT